MIESTFESRNDSNDLHYPCIRESTLGLVVLFHERGKGILIGVRVGNNTKTPYKIGEYSQFWAMENFTIIPGPVTLRTL